MRHDAWTDFELQVLYDHVNDLEWFESAAALLPRRTPNAIRTKMSLLRMEAGIIPRAGPRARSRAAVRREDAETGSARLLSATLAMVAA